jgi:cytochrome P450
LLFFCYKRRRRQWILAGNPPRFIESLIRYRGAIDLHLVNHPALVWQVMRAAGEAWKRKRKLMQPMFSPSAIGSWFSLMRDAADSTVLPTDKPFDIAGRTFFQRWLRGFHREDQ